ncbi:MAG: hypothetical protein Q9N34_03480, partial [Aquificota bacterium]|nr:hypothetical protein [Aquificota bacterium]
GRSMRSGLPLLASSTSFHILGISFLKRSFLSLTSSGTFVWTRATLMSLGGRWGRFSKREEV